MIVDDKEVPKKPPPIKLVCLRGQETASLGAYLFV